MPSNNGITIGADGYFQRRGQRVIPVGVNYWPASCGVEMWPQWPVAEIQRDLDIVRGLGLNCVRFFLRWPDFETDAGMWDRLRQFLGWCRDRQLLAHPTLVVGFMSGGQFWPKFKEQRNLYADALIVERCAAYCRRAAEVIAPFHDDVLAVDLGNELNVLQDTWNAAPAAVRNWCAAMTTAIRAAYPAALIVSGTDSGPVFLDNGWRLGDQPGTDLYSVHTYPVPNWNVVAFDGMTDPFCQAILPFNVLAARQFGPVMAQEFSTILTHGQPECESYLDAVLPACWANGANGFLWWCLRDIHADIHPYVKGGFEGRLGLVDDRGVVKPALAKALEFLCSLSAGPAHPPADMALYWPEHWYHRDNPQNPGNQPTNLYRRLLIAHYLLPGRVELVRGRPATNTLVVTGAALTAHEAARLEGWVRDGGHLIWSGPTWPQWTASVDAMIGAQPVDIRTPRPVTVECFGARWTLEHFTSDGRVLARPTTARVVAACEDGEPVILRNNLGKGMVTCVLPVAEDTIVAAAANRPARERWRQWYAGLLAERP